MAAKASDTPTKDGAIAAEAVTKGADTPATPETVVVQTEKATGEAALAALARVTEVVEQIAKATGATPSLDDEAAFEAEVTKGGGDRSAFFKGLKKSGMKGAELKKAMADFDAEAKKAAEPTAKAAEATPAPADTDEAVSKALEAIGEAVTKAKTFTPKRVEKLQGAIEQLQKLFDEMKSIPQGASPKGTQPGGASFGDSGVAVLTKGLEEIKEVLKGLTTEHKNVAERVEKIEKARNPSTSLEPEGGTDALVEKSKGMWSGLL